MKINISDARARARGSACCRWALLKLDLCSITAILHPRRPRHPSREAAREASRRFYLYAPQASRVSATSLSRRQRARKKRKKGEKKKKERTNKEGTREGESGTFRRAIYFEFYISRRISRARRISARSLRFLRRPLRSRGTTATWIISIFAPAKVSRRDYRDATRFHPRRGGKGEEGSAGRVTRLRRLNITVNRARRNSDAGAGAGAETSIKMARDRRVRRGGGRRHRPLQEGRTRG